MRIRHGFFVADGSIFSPRLLASGGARAFQQTSSFHLQEAGGDWSKETSLASGEDEGRKVGSRHRKIKLGRGDKDTSIGRGGDPSFSRLVLTQSLSRNWEEGGGGATNFELAKKEDMLLLLLLL